MHNYWRIHILSSWGIILPVSFCSLFCARLTMSWEASPVEARSSTSFFQLLQSIWCYIYPLVFQPSRDWWAFILCSQFSTAISAAIITVYLRLCEHMWRFPRQITRTRNGTAGAQSMCVFYANRCCGLTFLSSRIFPSSSLMMLPLNLGRNNALIIVVTICCAFIECQVLC